MQSRELTLLLTWACDIRCAHCNQDHAKTHLDVPAAKRVLRGLCKLGEIDRYSFTGGEPFLRYPAMLAVAAVGAQLGLPFGVISNGRWARTPEIARERLVALRALGLDLLVVSYDPFHEAFVPAARLADLLRIAAELGVLTQVYVSRADLTPIGEIIASVAARLQVATEVVSVRDVVPLGSGAALGSPAALPYGQIDKACPTHGDYTVWPDGKVLPCCSAGTHEGLAIGNVYSDSAKAIVKRRRASRLLAMLHRHDLHEVVIRLPAALRDRLASGHYVHACQLCHDLVSDPAARAAAEQLDANAIGLIEKLLESPALAAQLPPPRTVNWRGPKVVCV
ncbi:radical SAM/SPASM domain-containing protein [Chitinimonas sp.]|uniref:radical SAM/SPASM domain-containing protein n=1 Tax=Chitinimonas sp. TaxID=1934313 RepID=UPI0035B2BE9A